MNGYRLNSTTTAFKLERGSVSIGYFTSCKDTVGWIGRFTIRCKIDETIGSF